MRRVVPRELPRGARASSSVHAHGSEFCEQRRTTARATTPTSWGIARSEQLGVAVASPVGAASESPGP
jgi:hypothetical protein